MDSGDEQQPQKKRRVTKACDQCRRRRIKCESFPKAAIDAPCVICTEAGNANECTYSRPTKKRGPQAGRAKSLEERNATFERLMGHLLITVPNLTSHIESFVASSQAAPSPSSASSSTAVLTTPEQQQTAWSASAIPELLESVIPSVVASTAAGAAGPAKAKVELPSPAGTAQSVSTPETSLAARKIAGLPSPSPSTNTTAMQALSASLGAGPSAAGAVAEAAGAVPPKALSVAGGLEIPTLPSESVRNQLLDLYFNQVVHPHYPMLNKSRFLRWSAHLPSASSSSSAPSLPPPSAQSIPPALYLSVFALASAYTPPSSSSSTHPPEVWAAAARAHLVEEVMQGRATVETVQAAVLCALSDWGAGEVRRAWMLSGLSLTIALSLSLHLSATHAPDTDSLKLKTFHSALILHTLLSLRLSLPPLIVLEDYDVPVPPDDGAENFDLWKSDKTVGELRSEWGDDGAGASSSAADGAIDAGGGGGGGATAAGARVTQAVRSASLSTFTRMASLCAIGLAVLRWYACPRRGNGQGLPAGEQERAELVASLAGWEDDLALELRLGEGVRMVERLSERARWTVEMHMIVAALYLKLKPHPSYASTVPDPLPQSLGLLNHILSRYRDLFTLYRSLPTIDVPLHFLAETLFEQADYAPHQHDTALRAYEELGRVFPGARESWKKLAGKVDAHKRELGLLRGVHPTVSSHPSPPTAPLAPAPLVEPFQSFLDYSNELGPAASSSTVLDFGMWDQTDLLVSLGLVMDAGTPATATAPGGAVEGVGPAAGAGPKPGEVHMPPVIPPSSAPPPPANHISPPPQLQQAAAAAAAASSSATAAAMAISPPAATPSTAAAPTPAAMPPPPPQPQQPAQQAHYPPTFPIPPHSHPHYPPPAAPALFLPTYLPTGTTPSPYPFPPHHPHPASYPYPGAIPYSGAPFYPPPSAAAAFPDLSSAAGGGGGGGPLFNDADFSALPGDWPSTDMVTRWMDRGSLFGGFEGLGMLPNPNPNPNPPGGTGGAGAGEGGGGGTGGEGRGTG
ncbi:hypothetical protein JCM8097_006242 [Rhodosporidiobolus ruineniae]